MRNHPRVPVVHKQGSAERLGGKMACSYTCVLGGEDPASGLSLGNVDI
jgi:hypothetical protein